MSTSADISKTEAGKPTHGRGRVKIITVPRLDPVIEERSREGLTISKNVRPGLSQVHIIGVDAIIRGRAEAGPIYP